MTTGRDLTEYEKKVLAALDGRGVHSHTIAKKVYGKRWEREQSKKGAFIRSIGDALGRLMQRGLVEVFYFNNYAYWFSLAEYEKLKTT